ncbi:MAG: type II secretion system minor pseudopilin GspI [Enterobacterales bacterium]|nr:type II secretion system minor pseudopilin GspI [Enterobacterales bacterium]
MMPNQLFKKTKGFTLLEVLIALAVFSYGAVGFITNISKYQKAQVTSVERTVAHWVAMNQISLIRLEKKWPNLGVTRGTAEMANSRWYWIQTVTKTTEKQLRQVKVEVKLKQDDENTTVSVTAFVANKIRKR